MAKKKLFFIAVLMSGCAVSEVKLSSDTNFQTMMASNTSNSINSSQVGVWMSCLPGDGHNELRTRLLLQNRSNGNLSIDPAKSFIVDKDGKSASPRSTDVLLQKREYVSQYRGSLGKVNSLDLKPQDLVDIYQTFPLTESVLVLARHGERSQARVRFQIVKDGSGHEQAWEATCEVQR